MDPSGSSNASAATSTPPATSPAHVLMKRGRRGAASHIHSSCSNGGQSNLLSELLDILLNPGKNMDEWETIDWCKWLMAGGRTPDEFSSIVRRYDNATTCGLVWTANFVAYRCRTCGISPCMSLCADCFKRGDHDGHDYNMFRSQAGGACDCGDTSVMKETGFCAKHGPKAQVNKPLAPFDLMCVAEAVMPRIILRLIQHLRENSKTTYLDSQLVAIQDADLFLSMLHDMSAMGAAMRRVMTSALTNPQIYKHLTECSSMKDGSSMLSYMVESQRMYEEAVKTLANPPPPQEYKDCPALQEYLNHKTFLEELVFWTVKFEFPQKIVCLLLNMLPDLDYKEALTQAFVLHYSRISVMLERSTDPDTLSNRVVHVSVQLFSNEALALRMADKLMLLHVMVISLKYMMSKILIPNTLHVKENNKHMVVDCGKQVMKEHCYWPLVSDLNNVLSHRPVAVKFMSDTNLLEMWFKFLSVFQGMNVNQREVNQHVEFEPNTYYAAFSAELEASAYPMWALLSHLWDTSPTSVGLTKRVLTSCLAALQDWLDAIGMNHMSLIDDTWSDNHQVSFHLPLHRYLSVFMCQAVNVQGVPLAEVLPPLDVLHLIMMHPLRVQVAFYEILNGLWVRNGLQIKGQAMTYIQCNFCNSMVDSDFYLLQICATQLPAETFLQTVIDKFHINDWLSFSTPSASSSSGGAYPTDTDTPMLESCLTFLASLVSLRTNLGVNSSLLSQLEMVTLLCMGDKTHSQLMELMPERCGTAQSRDFEARLAEVADYRAPNLEASGNMQQGMYVPKAHVWQHIYDPLHVLLRAVHRRDFQTSMDRYAEHVHQTGKLAPTRAPWPPYRHPTPTHAAYTDPRRLLCCRVFHALAFTILYKAVSLTHTLPEHVISLIIYLLEMCVQCAALDQTEQPKQVCSATASDSVNANDLEFGSFYESDWLSNNLRTTVNTITLSPEPAIVINSEISDSEGDFFDNYLSSALELDLPALMPALTPPPNQEQGASSNSQSEHSSLQAAIMEGLQSVPNNLSLLATAAQLSVIRHTNTQSTATGQSSTSHASSVPGRAAIGQSSSSYTSSVPGRAAIGRSSSSRASSSKSSTPASAVINLSSASSSSSVSSRAAIDQATPTSMVATPTSADATPTSAEATPTSEEQGAESTATTDMQLIPTNPNLALELNSNSQQETAGYSRLAALPSTSGAAAVENGTTSSAVVQCPSSRCQYASGSKRNPKNRMLNQFSSESSAPPERKVKANESIISLLLKLHSQLSGVPDSFNPDEEDPDPDSRIGDGPVFVGKLLRRIMALDSLCRENVIAVRERLWPRQPEEGEAERREREERERGERRRRAKERQQKLMEEFASQQKQFMERTLETEDDGMDWEAGEENSQMLSNKKEYDCVICNQTSPSTDEKLMGLAVLVQATSVLGHKRRSSEPAVLPTSDQERANFSRNDTLGSDFDRRIEEIDRHFDKLSWLVSVNLGWEGGVHVQTCGHHLHLDCLKSYLRSLMGQQRISAERGEYSCPLCRQLANSVLPLPPELGDCAAVVRSRPSSLSASISELTNFLKDNLPANQTTSSLMIAMSKLMEDMTNSTYLKCKQEIFGNCNPQMLFLFVSSVARTNLEIELVQRGGSLCSLSSMDQSLIPKRSCIMPLLHVLAEHAKKLAQWPAWETWQQLAGCASQDDTAPALIPAEPPMPLMLRDPTALLIHFILLLPLHLDQTYFSTVVKLLYNLVYFQVVVQLSCTMKERQRSWWRKRELETPCTTLEHAMSMVIGSLDPTHLYAGEEEEEEEGKEDDEEGKQEVAGARVRHKMAAPMEVDHMPDREDMELKTQQLCLPFLRVAALLRHHLYEQPMPEIENAESEFVRLVYYLELVTEGMEWKQFNAARALAWPTSNGAHIRDWMRHLGEFIRRSQPVARSFLSEQHIVWHQPRLLTLPQLYDKIFQYYHRRQCQQCHSVPRETSICLLCGALVCLKENCCKNSNICEAVQHSLDCGAGTAMYLVVTSSYVIVIRGKRACLWGSVYLDNYGEEDRELKRGKPLYLSAGRYQLLQQQWLAHRFDHTNKKWVWHRDAL